MFVTEEYRHRTLLGIQGTGTTGGGYVAPTTGTQYITIRAIVTMGNDADLALTLNSADDTTGTNAVAFQDVPMYINGVRQTANGHTAAITGAAGNFIVDFSILPGQIPQGKTIGLAFGASNAANLIAAELIEDVTYEPAES